jgi:hypothetical protein
MHGDFSVLRFDPREHQRGVSPPGRGVLRNVNGVLHQQGRVMSDADLTEGELLELAWDGQAGRDVIGEAVAAVPATSPEGFTIAAAFVAGSDVHVSVRPGRAWADGILTRLAGDSADPAAAVERRATYFGPPIADPAPSPASIGDNVRDAVVLEVSEEALHAFQYPDRLLEPALGGPDTSERSYVNIRFRLLRLGPDEDCTTIAGKLADNPSALGKLTVSLAPVIALGGDCPVVGGGGYTGFEHHLYRVEIADGTGPVRFKWSQWNGGLAGRGRFDATTTPAKVFIDAGRASIVNSGLADFYLEALQYDDLEGRWIVVYGTTATLNSDHDLELAAPAVFGALPSTTDPVFFRLWNGLEEVATFTNAVTPHELRDGIRLVFDAPAAGNYRSGDYWTFTVRAGEIANPAVLIDDAPPTGIVYHRVPLAEINWTARLDTRVSGTIEDCRKRFRPLTNQKVCCTLLVGDGITTFGDFNSLEEAAQHLPAAGGELCLLSGFHRANLLLDGRRNVTIHGCGRRSLVIPRTETKASPIIRLVDCVGVKIHDLDLLTYDGIAVTMEGREEGSCRDVRIEHTRIIARANAIRATNAAELGIAHNRLHLLDTTLGRATVSIAADDVRIERNTLVMMPFVDETPNEPDVPDDDPTRDPADPCARPEVLYAFPKLVLLYAVKVWTFALAKLIPKQPYRAIGGIHVRAGSERVRIVDNVIVGGAGNGVTLGGDLEPPETPPPPRFSSTLSLAAVAPRATTGAEESSPVAITVGQDGQFLALVEDEAGQPVADLDVYLEGGVAGSDRTDAQGMASIKGAAGPATVDVAPPYRIVRVAETRDNGALVHAITVAQQRAVAGRGFLHEIAIEQNDISAMGLSGVGFALRTGASIQGRPPAARTNDPRANLLAAIDDVLFGLALTPLLRGTDPVRDLTILGNRIHHNLRNPFDQTMRDAAQLIGRGGVSLAIVDSAVVSENHVYENGPRAADPVCGVFVGYGNDLEITDNVLAANGANTDDYERGRQAGIRGGVYIRFAGALTSRSSTSSGRKPALRVHDNRIDQPAGRALTVFAFGPVSCANNHFNSELTGQFQILDTAVGGLLIINFGGIHRLLARAGTAVGRAGAAAVAEASLPGGETMVDDNYVRLGSGNRSLMSQGVLALDDVGFATNQSSIFHGDPLLANVVLIGDSIRATASRFREDATRAISLLSVAFRMNMVSLNQADHCIVALPDVPPVHHLPTTSLHNQVIDYNFCSRTFSNAPAGFATFFARSMTSVSADLGGTLSSTSFTAADVNTASRGYLSRSLASVTENEVVRTKAYQFEAARLSQKLGADNPRTVSVKVQADAGAPLTRLLARSAEAARNQTPAATATTATVSGQVVNDKGQGQEGYVVELVRADGTRVETVGRTDASGHYAASYDDAKTAALANEGNLFLRIVDPAGKETFRATDATTVNAGTNVRSTTTTPVRVVPRSVVTTGTEIFRARSVQRSTTAATASAARSGAPPDAVSLDETMEPLSGAPVDDQAAAPAPPAPEEPTPEGSGGIPPAAKRSARKRRKK